MKEQIPLPTTSSYSPFRRKPLLQPFHFLSGFPCSLSAFPRQAAFRHGKWFPKSGDRILSLFPKWNQCFHDGYQNNKEWIRRVWRAASFPTIALFSVLSPSLVASSARVRLEARSIKRYVSYRTYLTNHSDPSQTPPAPKVIQSSMEGRHIRRKPCCRQQKTIYPMVCILFIIEWDIVKLRIGIVVAQKYAYYNSGGVPLGDGMYGRWFRMGFWGVTRETHQSLSVLIDRLFRCECQLILGLWPPSETT